MRPLDNPNATNVDRQTPRSLARKFSLQRVREQAIAFTLFLCALLSILTTVGIIYVLVTESIFGVGTTVEDGKKVPAKAFFQEVSPKEFLTETKWTPQYQDKHYGVLPLLGGTFLVAGIAALIGLPIGLFSAVYLSEYASPRARNCIKPILEILAGIPTVVYGYFALVFVTPYLLKPIFQDWLGFEVSVFNAASAGIVVGIMIIPMVSSLSEDTLRAVPRGLREAGYALGSTKFDVSVRVVLPASISGILASFLLAIARAIGETMAVTIAAGQTPALTMNPFESVQTMTSYIVNVSLGDTPVGSMSYKSLYAIALTLFCITLAMNFLSQIIMRRFREVYE
jgi:phosphate transport system permease protein